MFRKAMLSTVIVAMVLSGCQTVRPQTPNVEMTSQGGAVISDPSGVTISIPPEGLYQSSELSIAEVDMPTEADTQTFLLPGDSSYTVELGGDDAFRLPVEISIPYDPELLPDGHNEAEIFPVFLYDGVWYRQEGALDQESNVVRVLTVHNGMWDWAIDPIVEHLTGESANFFCVEGQDLPTLEEARAELERRHTELLLTLERTQFNMEEIEDPQIALDVTQFLVGEETETIVSNELALFARRGGRDAIIRIGNRRVGMWLGRLGTAVSVTGLALNGFELFVKAEQLGGALYQVTDLLRAYHRWREAKAIVYALENGCLVVNMYPEDAAALADYYAALPIDQTLGRPAQVDLSISAVPETIDGWIEPVTSGYTDIESFKQALAEALENMDFQRLGELTSEHFYRWSYTGAIGTADSAYWMEYSRDDWLNLVQGAWGNWQTGEIQVDTGDMGNQLFASLGIDSQNASSYIYAGMWNWGKAVLGITFQNGHYYWSEIVPDTDVWLADTIGPSRFPIESRPRFDITHFDDFVRAIEYAFETPDYEILSELLADNYQYHQICLAECPGLPEYVQHDRAWALDYFQNLLEVKIPEFMNSSWMRGKEGVVEVTVTDMNEACAPACGSVHVLFESVKESGAYYFLGELWLRYATEEGIFGGRYHIVGGTNRQIQ